MTHLTAIKGQIKNSAPIQNCSKVFSNRAVNADVQPNFTLDLSLYYRLRTRLACLKLSLVFIFYPTQKPYLPQGNSEVIRIDLDRVGGLALSFQNRHLILLFCYPETGISSNI